MAASKSTIIVSPSRRAVEIPVSATQTSPAVIALHVASLLQVAPLIAQVPPNSKPAKLMPSCSTATSEVISSSPSSVPAADSVRSTRLPAGACSISVVQSCSVLSRCIQW